MYAGGTTTKNGRGKVLVATIVAGFLIAVPVTHAATTGTGTASAIVGGFVEITVTDSTIAAFSATPTSSDPGPRVHSTSDGFTFSNLYSNTRSMFSMDITSATDSGASSTETIQGTVHTIADWVYVRQNSGANYGTYEVVGTYDSNAGAYTAPGGFTKSSQGTFQLKHYVASSPTDGGDGTTTVNWIYDSTANQYYFDATDKDFTSGAQLVNPSSKTGQTQFYTYAVNGINYGVTSVAGAGSNYVPTVRQAWQVDFSTAGSTTHSAYLLIDFPSGTPKDTYSITMTTTITALTT